MNVHDVNVALDGIDVVLHLVSSTLPKTSNDDPVFDVQSNLVATLRMLEAMVVRGVRKIVFISSGALCTAAPSICRLTNRTRPILSVSYGITKLAIEKYLLMFEMIHGIKANILRVANAFGERQRLGTAQGAVTVFLHHALRQQPIEIWGDGSVTRDYIYVDDVAEAFARAVQYSGPEERV